MSTVTFQIPDDVRADVEELAKREGVTIDEFFSKAAAERVKAVQAMHYLETVAARANRADWDYVLSRVPDRPPLPGDELPDDLREALQRQSRQAL